MTSGTVVVNQAAPLLHTSLAPSAAVLEAEVSKSMEVQQPGRVTSRPTVQKIPPKVFPGPAPRQAVFRKPLRTDALRALPIPSVMSEQVIDAKVARQESEIAVAARQVEHVASAKAAAPVVKARAMTAPGEVEDAGRAAQLMAVLHQEINRQKRYPYIAKRRGMDGVTTIAFRLGPDGEIAHIKVLESSGYGVLDKAAGAAVARVSPLVKASSYLEFSREFQVKVVFARN